MENLYIRYRHQKTLVDLPSDWKLLTFADFGEHSRRGNVKEITLRALAGPVQSKTLEDHLSPSDRVVVIVEDMTRASPKKQVLEVLFDALRTQSIPDGNVSVVLALGTHRAPSQEELREVYGKASVDRYEFLNHDCYARDLVPVGKLKTGKEVRINRRVCEADFRVGVGSIFPHPMNGFGGGGKILFPGVSDFESIREHHLAYSFRAGSELGRIDANPFHEEICTMARLGNLNFIINSVLDHNDHLYDVVCGDPIEAHRAGVHICRDIISRKFEKKADVTVISAFPYMEGPQIMKPLAPASMITKTGGCIILCADVKGKLPDQLVGGFEAFHRKYGGNLRKGVIENFEKRRLIFEDRPIEFNMAGGQALLAQHEFNIILVSEDIPKTAAEKIGFRFAEDLDRAFKMASGMLPPKPEVHIIPSGGVILPVI